MKRLFLSFLCLIFLFQARLSNAQSSHNNQKSWRYTASFELMVPPISTLNESNNMGYGINLQAEYFLNKALSVALMTGYNYFPGSLNYYYVYPYNVPQIVHPKKVYYRGIPFQIIPIMAGIHYYPAKWFYLSDSAGLAMGGSEGSFKAAVSYEPEIGFLIPIKNSFIDLGIKFLYTNLRVEDTYSGMGGVINGTDFAQAMGISLGWKF